MIREEDIRKRAPEAFATTHEGMELQLTQARLDRVELLRLLDAARTEALRCREMQMRAYQEQIRAEIALDAAIGGRGP